MKSDVAEQPGKPRASETRWSIILSASDSSEADHRQALAELCQIYWRPIFAFIRRWGFSSTDAQDLTQDFFLTVLAGDLLQRANPERGRFRSLLFRSLQNFLIETRVKQGAQKRGGYVQFISWDQWKMAPVLQPSISQHAQETSSAERLFDVRWAATIVERALSRLREECETHGRRSVFDVLSASLSAERVEICYSELAASLGASEATVKRLLHQLRRRYRSLLREEVARTVEAEADVEDEIRHLCAALVEVSAA